MAFVERTDLAFESADLFEAKGVDKRVLRAEVLEDIGGRHAERRGDIGYRNGIETALPEKFFRLGENVPPGFLGGTAGPASDRTVTLPVGLSRLFDHFVHSQTPGKNRSRFRRTLASGVSPLSSGTKLCPVMRS